MPPGRTRRVPFKEEPNMAWKPARNEPDVQRVGVVLQVDFAAGRIIGPKEPMPGQATAADAEGSFRATDPEGFSALGGQ